MGEKFNWGSLLGRNRENKQNGEERELQTHIESLRAKLRTLKENVPEGGNTTADAQAITMTEDVLKKAEEEFAKKFGHTETDGE